MAGAVRNIITDRTSLININSSNKRPPAARFISNYIKLTDEQKSAFIDNCNMQSECKNNYDQKLLACKSACAAKDSACVSSCSKNSFKFATDLSKLPFDSETKWTTQEDVFYSIRKPTAYVYYRSYDGSLIHKKTESLQEMGEFLSQQNDFYVCTAKRYFYFFTGINVSLRDLGDPLQPVQLSSRDLYFRNLVIKMGLNLKKTQRLDQLVYDIISTPEYQKRDYGVGITESGNHD